MEKHYCSWSRLQYVNSGITIFLQNTPHKHFFTCIIQQWLCLIWQLLPSFSQTQSVFGCITETSTELFPPPDTKSGLSRGALSSAETLITALCISTLWLSLLPTERDCSAKPGSIHKLQTSRRVPHTEFTRINSAKNTLYWLSWAQNTLSQPKIGFLIKGQVTRET